MTAVEVSLENKEACVSMDADLPDQLLMDAVTEAGYTAVKCVRA